jgi:2-polyprenyl-3-methyl-5-hydroxy-6-metoxy-1,4-benzoquinol methylase
MNGNEQYIVSSVRDYWDSHPLGLQYVRDKSIAVGSPEFFAHIRPWMNPFKYPWIMERIEHEATRLKGKHLLEVGCGLGFDSLEFLKHGVRVTATDLTPTAIELTLRHFELEGFRAEDVRIENVLSLSFNDNTFDAVWADGVIHHTGNTAQAIKEIRRVLKPGGRAIISNIYLRSSWMYWLSRLGRENIEYKEEDPPVTNFLTEKEILLMFDGFFIEKGVREHYRALPVARRGFKASLYKWIFRPIYNLLPESISKRYAFKYSIIAVKT